MIVSVFIPATVFILLAIAGTELTGRGLFAATRAPLTIYIATVAQIVVLPLLAFAAFAVLRPDSALLEPMILIAACPAGAISNYFCYLGRANVALSVSLTVSSNLLAIITIPLVLAIAFPGESMSLTIPPLRLAAGLGLFLLVPIGLGALLRHYFPRLVFRWSGMLRVTSVALVVVLTTLVIREHWETTRHLFVEAAILTMLFTAAAAFAGYLVASLLRLEVVIDSLLPSSS